MKHNIDKNGLYLLTTKNRPNEKRVVTPECLLNNYLRNRLNSDSVVSWERKEGAWHDISYKGKSVFSVYARNKQEALEQRKDDLINLGYTNQADFTFLVHGEEIINTLPPLNQTS